jgi:hypothetical protein
MKLTDQGWVGDTASVMPLRREQRRALRRALAILLWCAGLLAVGAVMVVVGRGSLAGPRLAAPSTWAGWAAARPAPDAAVAVLRLVVLALDAYLLGVTALAVGVRLVRAERAITIADLFTVPTVLRVVQTGLGVGLLGASVAAAASGGAGLSTRPTHADIALVSVDDEPPTIRELTDESELVTTTTTPVTTSTTSTTSTTAVAPPVVAVSGAEPTPQPEANMWLVRPGDHFWSIAERTLTGAWGREPTDAEIVPYWQELVDRNRDALADRDNADLIFPGQAFMLPITPAAP